MKRFEHIAARDYEEAARLVREGNGKTDVIAGGTDLLGTYKDRLLETYPETVVSIKNIPDSDYIREEDESFVIGAGTTLKHLSENEALNEKIPALAEAAHSVASPLIRATATIGGNVCQDVRCWYYRYPNEIGGRLNCRRKGGETCYAIAGENRYHSIFGGMSTGASACQESCPAGTDIAAYMAKIRENDWDGAAEIFFRVNPMPMMTSRICPHLCTETCNQNVYGESVNIPAVERTLGDYILANKEKFYAAPAHETGKKAAVIGAGPGGLTAAFYLRRAGHDVTVYDSHEKPGGVLQYGIPHYRLPKTIVDEFCNALRDIMGIHFVMNTTVGKDITVEEIRKNHDKVYFGTGAWSQPVLGLDGENLTYFGLNFLEEVNTYLKKTIGEEVLVCGGGNVAMDVALTAKRLGAKCVRLVCLEQREEMPASNEEIERAIEEGVEIYNGWGLGKVLSNESNKVTGLLARKCISVRDETGRFNPSYDEEDTRTFDSDFIILATGQRVDVSFLEGPLAEQLKTVRGLLDADIESGRTKEADFYAGGDAVTGPNLAIRAIRAGRSAAASMNRDLGISAAETPETEKFTHFDVNGVEETKQHRLKDTPADERTLADEDTVSFTKEQALEEAKRCLHCACYAVNPSDITPVLVMLGAEIQTTERILSAEELFTQRLTVQQVLHRGELVTEIRVPKKSGEVHYDKRRVRDAIDFAIVSLADRIVLEDGVVREADLVYGGVAPVPYRVKEAEDFLKGRKLDRETAKQAGEIAMAAAAPMRGNQYKVFMAKDVLYLALLRAAGIKEQEIPVL
ncbi:MAG: FAD binding domain-containing protein [Solobacterium sp.]|nr:FAD binding domain-containing protein [Solobacterium sp.]